LVCTAQQLLQRHRPDDGEAASVLPVTREIGWLLQLHPQGRGLMHGLVEGLGQIRRIALRPRLGRGPRPRAHDALARGCGDLIVNLYVFFDRMPTFLYN